MKRFPQAFTLEDNQRVILEFEKLLRDRGLKIPVNSPLEEASLAILEMLETRKNKAVHNKKVDCREKWRQAFFLADIARKALRGQQHPDFNKLLLHLKLLLEPGNFSQFSASRISASPKEKETNNKVFELFVAVILLQICSNLRFDNPHSSKGDNPDVIGEYNAKRWAFACKVSHSKNPLAFLQRVRDGVVQIEKAKTDRGIVVINLKNLIPHDEIWPAIQDKQSGEWEYGAYPYRDAPVIKIRYLFRQFEQDVYDLVGGRKAFIDEFIGKKTVPMVLMFYCSVTGHSPHVGVVVPMIVKQMTGIGVPTEQLDSEAGKVIDLFNDYLHDKIE
jgi:hypothetical protein